MSVVVGSRKECGLAPRRSEGQVSRSAGWPQKGVSVSLVNEQSIGICQFIRYQCVAISKAQTKPFKGDLGDLLGLGQLNQKVRDDKRTRQRKLKCRVCSKKMLLGTCLRWYKKAVHSLSLRTQQNRGFCPFEGCSR